MSADEVELAVPVQGVVDLPGLAVELRRVCARGRECPLLNALEVGGGLQALASLGVELGEGWHL